MTRRRRSPIAPMILMTLLAGCASAPSGSVLGGLGDLSAACPMPLSPAALTRAADYLDAHPDAAPIVADLDTLDRQARTCRGEAK